MACELQIVTANTSHFYFMLTVSAPQIRATRYNGYKMNVYSSSHRFKSHHLLSAVGLNISK